MDSATPVWVVVLVAAIGIVGTLLAALITQTLTTRREAKQAREQVDREIGRARQQVTDAAEHQRAEAERAERAQLATQKRGAYTELLVTASRWERYIGHKRDQRVARNGAAVPLEMETFADDVDRAYATVQILGEPHTLEPATRAYHNLLLTVVHLEASHFSVARVDEGRELVKSDLAAFLAAVRREFAIDEATPLSA
ncbi:MAG: hypothetical protein M3P48_08265 [Actinomycetota bacterium]|nr:hypothetical protein [Actinomycetota bacterium]